jgi:hypothetical protein
LLQTKTWHQWPSAQMVFTSLRGGRGGIFITKIGRQFILWGETKAEWPQREGFWGE